MQEAPQEMGTAPAYPEMTRGNPCGSEAFKTNCAPSIHQPSWPQREQESVPEIVGGNGVGVGVAVLVGVGVKVGVAVKVGVEVWVGVEVKVGVDVLVGVNVKVGRVGVRVGVEVGVLVGGSGVGVSGSGSGVSQLQASYRRQQPRHLPAL